MKTESNCIFCKIISEKIPSVKIWEDKEHLAFLDITPINPGHVLVIPKKHFDYLFDLPDSEYVELMLKTKEISKILKSKLNSKRIGVVVEGFGVPHIHIHLIPINKANEITSGKIMGIKEEELNKIAEKIRN